MATLFRSLHLMSELPSWVSSGALWQETQSVTTSQFGNLALTIGDGAATPGMTESLDMVDWSALVYPSL